MSKKLTKINIRGQIDIIDPFYRYQRRPLDVVRQRTMTSIKNLDDVADDIERDKELIILYYKTVFGTNFKKKDSEILTTKDITYDEFNNVLNDFIEYFVLCEKCRLPETDMIFENKKNCLFCRCCSTVTKLDKHKNKHVVKVLDHINKK